MLLTYFHCFCLNGIADEEHELEGTQFQQEENTEIPEDTIEVPVVEEDYDRESEDKMPDILATPESFQEGICCIFLIHLYNTGCYFLICIRETEFLMFCVTCIS